MKSQIIQYIRGLPPNQDWREAIKSLNISVKEDHNLAIFNYGIEADFSNPVVQEARGIIINTKTWEVCCWPFRRFMNSHEQYADTIDWNNCRVESKIDGSIIKLWFHCSEVVLDWLTPEPQGYWQWSTNSCISASEANISGQNITFQDLIKMAVNYDEIPFDQLDKSCTYIFELVSPLHQIVIKYPTTKLYHIGTRNNVTGEEFRTYIGIEQPKTYDIHSLEDCVEAANHLNDNVDGVKKEGFVVVDKDWHRVKVKSPLYLAFHHTWTNGRANKEKLIGSIIAVKNNGETAENLSHEFPRLAVEIKYYDFRLSELERNIQLFIDYVRGLYEEYNRDRKTVALQIKDNKYASFGFAAIDNDLTAKDLLDKMTVEKICRFIPDYEREEILK